MTILDIDQIVKKANEKYASYSVPAFVFLSSDLTTDSIRQLEYELDVIFDDDFRAMLLEYNFGNLTLGWVSFHENSTNKAYLLKYNKYADHPWWGSGDRPNNILLIAGTDAYNIFINTETGHILATDVDIPNDQFQVIASCFSVFIRAVGTLSLCSKGPMSPQEREVILSFTNADHTTHFWS